MPVYDYLCGRCGAFTAMRPMAECDRPNACPNCGRAAERAFLTAPYFSAMTAERRQAHATNERSAHAPLTLSRMKAAHGAGCSCCAGKPMRNGKGVGNGSRSGVKGFPGARPWMISH
jgi:putative FmdB family regulatory protein